LRHRGGPNRPQTLVSGEHSASITAVYAPRPDACCPAALALVPAHPVEAAATPGSRLRRSDGAPIWLRRLPATPRSSSGGGGGSGRLTTRLARCHSWRREVHRCLPAEHLSRRRVVGSGGRLLGSRTTKRAQVNMFGVSPRDPSAPRTILAPWGHAIVPRLGPCRLPSLCLRLEPCHLLAAARQVRLRLPGIVVASVTFPCDQATPTQV
jgi:hypothetical protein